GAPEQGDDTLVASLRGEVERLKAEKSAAERREHEFAVLQQKTQAELAAVRGALEKAVTEKVVAEMAARATQAVVAQQSAMLPLPAAEAVAPAAVIATVAPAATVSTPTPGPQVQPPAEEPADSASVNDGFLLAAVRTPPVPWDLGGVNPTAGEDHFAPVTSSEPIGFPDEAEDVPYSSFGGDADDGPPQLFLPDKAMTAVEYGEPGDLVVLQASINVARITPDGELPQNSNAYICAIRTGEALRVYIALHLLQSGRTIVYVPEEQPVDDAACRSTLRSAVGFAEAVGFMMDVVHLSAEPAQRGEALKRVPVLRAGKTA
ncbi:MAG TPA: hypothetical protein VIU40_14750, partial [Geobacteraceae bacterium]